MWNGAVFIPLIDETDTIDPGSRCACSSAATAWLMKNMVSRFWVNSSRQSDRVDPGGRHPGRRAGAAGDVDQAVEVAVGVARPRQRRGDALVGRSVGRDRNDRQPFVDQGPDVRVEVLLRPAHRDDGRPGLGDHPGHRGADAAAAGAGHDDDASVEPAAGSGVGVHQLSRQESELARWRTSFYTASCRVKVGSRILPTLLSGPTWLLSSEP